MMPHLLIRLSSSAIAASTATADYIVRLPADDCVVRMPADDCVVRIPADDGTVIV